MAPLTMGSAAQPSACPPPLTPSAQSAAAVRLTAEATHPLKAAGFLNSRSLDQSARMSSAGGAMAENGIPWRRDAEKALDEAKESRNPALVDFTAAPM
jgi:hypothetical protein